MVRFLGPAPSVKAILDKLDCVQFGIYLLHYNVGIL